MSGATWLLAEFDARNKVAAVDRWTHLSRAIFRGCVEFSEPSLAPFGLSWACFHLNVLQFGNSCEPWNRTYTSDLVRLLSFIELRGDPPEDIFSILLPHDVELAARGQQLREQLPSYLEQQWASIVAHSPLPTMLHAIVAAYAAPTPADMWAD
jgi:hypothetical protein